MEKKYDTSEIIKIVDKAFINFEEMFKSEKSEKRSMMILTSTRC